MRESTIEKYLIRRVKDLGGEVRKIAWRGRRSAPDRLILLKKWHPMVELKAPGVKPTRGQLAEHETLRRAGVEVYVIDSIAKVDELLGVPVGFRVYEK